MKKKATEIEFFFIRDSLAWHFGLKTSQILLKEGFEKKLLCYGVNRQSKLFKLVPLKSILKEKYKKRGSKSKLFKNHETQMWQIT